MKLVLLSGKEMSKFVQKLGFKKVHQVGSHAKYVHPDGRITLVSMHGNEDIGPGLTNKIVKQLELSREEYNRLAKEL